MEKRVPTQATRKGNRVNDEGMLMAIKAEKAKEKQNTMTGNNKNAFCCLQSIDHDILINVANSNMISLGPNKESVVNNITTMLAKEYAQAAILETKRKIELAKQESDKEKQMAIEIRKETDSEREERQANQKKVKSKKTEEIEICSSPETENRDMRNRPRKVIRKRRGDTKKHINK